MTEEKKTPPPMEPESSEATEAQLSLAMIQGEAYGRALDHMAHEVAKGGERRSWAST